MWQKMQLPKLIIILVGPSFEILTIVLKVSGNFSQSYKSKNCQLTSDLHSRSLVYCALACN